MSDPDEPVVLVGVSLSPLRFSEAKFYLPFPLPLLLLLFPSQPFFSCRLCADHDGGGGDGGCAAERRLVLVEAA